MPSRRLIANLSLVVGSVLIALLVFEGLLRLSTSRWELERRVFANKPLQGVAYRRLPSRLVVLQPNQVTVHVGACFETRPVTVNAQGFRGRTKTTANGGIALLGDSFVEALQIPDGLTLADRLERYTGKTVINAAVSGYATTHALRAWRERLVDFHPDWVVLLVYLGNDISGNSCHLSETEPPCGLIRNGAVAYLEPRRGEVIPSAAGAREGDATPPPVAFWRSPLRNFLRRHLALYALAHDVKIVVLGLAAEATGQVATRWGLYRATPNPDWEEAWRITADTLARLRDETRQANARLAIVAIPEAAALMANPHTAIRFGSASAVPQDFDPALPSRRLIEAAKELGIPGLDLRPAFLAYRDRYDLPRPQFSFACDGHWNPLGHALAAAAIADFLDGLGEASPMGLQLEAMMALAPRTLLGDEGYRQIFEGGVYRPKAEAEGATP